MWRYLIFLIMVWAPFETRAALFPVYKEIEPNVRFWVKVYSEWTTKQIVFVDTEDLNMVYYVASIPANSYPSDIGLFIERSKKELRQALDQLSKLNPTSEEGLDGLVKELYLALLPIQRPDKYQRGEFIRSQNGLRDRFELGLKLSGSYEQEIEARLLHHGLPKELLALVFVESLFYLPAKSSLGAAGLWQLLEGTAKESVKVNRLVDERFDPVLSTEAAVQYLQSAYRQWGSWPLTITSYNCGRFRIKNAIEQLGSNHYVEILRSYKHPRFGFAARNYYAEFLAALHVYQKAQTYFPNIEKNKAWEYALYTIPKPLITKSLFGKQANLEKEFYQLNPALKKEVRNGKEVLPPGLIVRFPLHAQVELEKRIANLSVQQGKAAEKRLRATHRAGSRQTLRSIAAKYDVAVHRLAERLGLKPESRLSKGKVVLVYSQDSQFSELPKPSALAKQ